MGQARAYGTASVSAPAATAFSFAWRNDCIKASATYQLVMEEVCDEDARNEKAYQGFIGFFNTTQPRNGSFLGISAMGFAYRADSGSSCECC
jgi:hypothetical protein